MISNFTRVLPGPGQRQGVTIGAGESIRAWNTVAKYSFPDLHGINMGTEIVA